MRKRIPSFLRVVSAGVPDSIKLEDEDSASIFAACEAFSSATGWQLEYVPQSALSCEAQNLMWSAPVSPGVGTSPGLFRLFNASPSEAPSVDRDGAKRLATTLAALTDELLRTRNALWRGEAELAAGVPVGLQATDESHLASRLEAVLRGGAQAVDCDAAALYLLDAATTELKLRASWGLPRRRLTDVARPLKDSLADLEALLGHAVVLTDSQMFRYWRSPELFGSAVCVPVSTPSMPLGTLWVFSHAEREFNDVQTNLVEMTAGRLAADLEREILRDDAVSLREYQREMTAVRDLAGSLAKRPTPQHEHWSIASRIQSCGPFGGAMCDWFAAADGGLRLVAGAARQTGFAGMLVANSIRAASRAVGADVSTEELLASVNRVLWAGSLGDEQASTIAVDLSADGARIEFAAAGATRAFHVDSEDHATMLAAPSDRLGTNESRSVSRQICALPERSFWIAYAISGALDETLVQDLDRAIDYSIQMSNATTADQWAEVVADALEMVLAEHPPSDRAVIVVQRRNSRSRC